MRWIVSQNQGIVNFKNVGKFFLGLQFLGFGSSFFKMMKKIGLIIVLLLVLVAGGWWLFANRVDYSKIVFVLPSSGRVSSPFYYKRCGDFFLARDLRMGFEKLGYEVEYRFREDYDDLKLGNAGNVIFFKGYYVFKNLPKIENKKVKTILYVYYMEGLGFDILKEADVVVGASKSFVERHILPKGLKGEVIPQFTNPDRFKSASVEEDKKVDVLFVGSNNYSRGRESVKFALKTDVELKVYGKKWMDVLEPEVFAGEFIDNDELYKYYSNAKIVLNDHRREMAYFGFVSNRIYDVSASGGFILSDYVKEIEDVYGDSIAMYKDFDDFKAKLKYYLEHKDEREEMIAKAKAITLKEFTNYRAAEKFDMILKNIKKN